MILKKKLLRNCKIYLILDREVNCYSDLLKITKHALKSGVNIFQLRDKSGKTREIIDFSKKLISEIKGKALFIVNDRVDIAKASGADGVHLGQEDLPVSEARKIIGKDSIVGVSC